VRRTLWPNGWVEIFGRQPVESMLDRLAEHPAFVPIRDSVRDRGAEKLHRITIPDAFGSEASVAVLREVMTAAQRSLEE
jgi:hypothetical protein